ncbi:MAG: Rqc2 family fibronectin-binding protein [Acetivibrionales bacterium]
MPFDGIVIKGVVEELSNKLINGRIEKIYQPEADEILISIRANKENYKLVMSASPNNPRIHLTETAKENPSSPPMFCMLLRKHISGGRILDVEFHNYERIISIHLEAKDELGDISAKKLVIEIMGRHSNIILVNGDNRIIDSIKHIDNEISSVREVMPARPYVFPPAQEKTAPGDINAHSSFLSSGKESFKGTVEKYLLNNIKGFSPLICREICFRSGIDGKTPFEYLTNEKLILLEKTLKDVFRLILDSHYSPCIVFEDSSYSKPFEFHCLQINQYEHIKAFSSVNGMLDAFYSQRDYFQRLRQKKASLLRILNNGIDRCNKKLLIHEEKLREVSDREKLRLFGELITANIYSIKHSIKCIKLQNYYSENGEYVEVPMDENLSPQKNAQRYFKKYNKAKSAFEYSNKQLEETQKELDYLQSVLLMLDNCTTVQDIEEIREELIEGGYLNIKPKARQKKSGRPSVPLHFKSSDGFDIFVGKSNKQNDFLTLKMASSNDIWLHTKNIPGSHVIIKKSHKEIPESTIEEAALLAAYHSKARLSSNVPVDYTMVKNVKKPNRAKPGMVIYDNYKTVLVTPDENRIKELKLFSFQDF